MSDEIEMEGDGKKSFPRKMYLETNVKENEVELGFILLLSIHSLSIQGVNAQECKYSYMHRRCHEAESEDRYILKDNLVNRLLNNIPKG